MIKIYLDYFVNFFGIMYFRIYFLWSSGNNNGWKRGMRFNGFLFDFKFYEVLKLNFFRFFRVKGRGEGRYEGRIGLLRMIVFFFIIVGIFFVRVFYVFFF